ncbi:sensor domain-containing diguanylate cyclase [Vibrio methylphosphonaticus]|uniref:sensor domain-containing diguanylate cyclase n=1 Tax=Vibrio methylphosphonaticus TaxID=2946866 RepID=UPI00202A9FDB|nr:sensor domain-containing diguanylate cyclase [Vibrio methylphosphonaticus]MCL9773854.1 sensor domain-containing diguanylate cyclase [Vibrio methylphosphonaticus]
MQTPPIPANEEYRVHLLRQLKILDTPREERFDRVTRLAKRMFNVDIALVSLIDEHRQWFKSGFGIDATETHRDISFCGHAILGDEPFIVPDALADRRFWDNPLVQGDPQIRFYAGVPLKLDGGEKIGTLCIIDRQPRHFTDQEVHDLIDLAKLAEGELVANLNSTIDELTQISNRRGFNELAEKVISKCRFSMEPYSLAYFDLNDFKKINDTLGHSIGDDALTSFSRLLIDNFRDSDVIARIGGDEFVVLMSGTTGGDARYPMTRFDEEVVKFNNASPRVYQLGYSVGVVSCSPLEDINHNQLLDRADKAMYQYKRE